jgi:GDP-L-fucose synthase
VLDLSQERVLVTGGTGFLGRHLCARLESGGGEVLGIGRQEFRFSNSESFANLLQAHRSTVVVHLAAVCGGIGANQARPAEMIHDNLLMACHVVRSASECPTLKKLVLLGSVCAYPKFCPTPFKESDLWNGYPEETNAPYGIAKRALFELAGAYHRQYGLKVACLMPANLYGPGDSFDEAKSHVIPAMIRKFVEARESGAASVTLWGTGTASRDFLYVEDCAEAITVAAERLESPEPINIGTGREVRIAELAETIAEIVGYGGKIIWDASRPDGQPRRRLDVSRAQSLLDWNASTDLAEGLRKTVQWYLANARPAELLARR